EGQAQWLVDGSAPRSAESSPGERPAFERQAGSRLLWCGWCLPHRGCGGCLRHGDGAESEDMHRVDARLRRIGARQEVPAAGVTATGVTVVGVTALHVVSNSTISFSICSLASERSRRLPARTSRLPLMTVRS